MDNPASLHRSGLSRRKKFVFSLTLVALGASVLLVFGEFYIRYSHPIDDAGWYELVDDPILFYRPISGKIGQENGHPRTHTRQGLRGPFEFDRDPPPGTSRVLWVGDSACFGSGVGDGQTAAYQFHQIAHAAGRKVDSINLAVVGFNVRQAREVLARRALEFHGVDTVVYFHHENDIVNAPWAALAPHIPSDLFWTYEAPQSSARMWLKRSALVRRMWNSDLVVRILGPGEGNQIDSRELREMLTDRSTTVPIHPFTKTCVSLYDEKTPYGRRFRDEVYEMFDMARTLGARFIMVYWPSRTLLHHDELDDLRTVLASWCRARGIEWLDVTEGFLASSDPDLYSDAIHPGTGGHRIIAQAVFDRWGAEP